MTYFISGHLDLTEAEFQEHYVHQIDKAVRDGADFIVCDARGCDAMAQKYLGELGVDVRVTIYHMHERPRNHNCHAILVGGFQSDLERDAAAITYSRETIGWVRPGREKSGTAKNIARRKATK